jgi:hypothetical protein
MGWTMLYLFFGLKLPILALFYLVWWAVHQTDPEAEGGDGGTKVDRRPHPHPHPRLPRHPRRGPHGDALPPSPPRVRSVTARARQFER